MNCNYQKMSEKFPPIENLDINDDDELSGDFLSREKAALGSEFATADDSIAAGIPPEQDEFSDFQSQYPEISKEQEYNAFSSAPNQEEEVEEESVFDKPEPQSVADWKSKRDAELVEKDKISVEKHEEIIKTARELTDQFYEDYNTKKDIKINEVKEEEEKFVEKRDNFFKNEATVWERAINLIDLKKSSSSVTDNRDKTKFKELLLSLKGKANVPAAGAY